MGLGDEIMAAAQARRFYEATGKQVKIIDGRGRPRWHDLWEGLGYVAKPDAGVCLTVLNAPGHRPYINYQKTTADRWAYTEWSCEPGEIAGIAAHPEAVGGVLIEPTLKVNASPNKQWGRWRELVKLRPELDWIQCCPPGQEALPGVRRIETKSFREACGALLSCRAAVLPEGGLHHAAAALGRRVVVLFGGMTSPKNTGYDFHDNLWVDAPGALGWRIPHEACAKAWGQITPEMVFERLGVMLES